MNPVDYVPVYDASVVEFLPASPDTTSVSIEKHYCLSPASAICLARFFTPIAAIKMMPPIPQAPGSPFQFNHLVPWLVFTRGGEQVLRNAGQLAIYWGMPGVPLAGALDMANQDVDTPVEV